MNIASFDLNLLLAFDALLEERSVSRAARRVGLSQPAMSNALRRLREIFRDPLFSRTAEGMLPTPHAVGLAGPIRAGLAQLRGVFEKPPSFAPSDSNRTFYLGMTDYAELVLLPSLLRRLERAAPEIQIVVRRVPAIFIPPETELRSGALDAAIGFFPDAASMDPAIYSSEIFSEMNVCITRRGHPLMRKPLTLKRFAALQHAAVFYRTENRGLIDNLLSAQGMRRRLRIASPHFLTVPFMVAEGDLIGVVPEGLAARFRRSLRLDVHKVPFEMPRLHMRVLWHERADADSANRWLRSQLEQCRPSEDFA